MNISKPSLGEATLPYPSAATIEPIWYTAEQTTLGGTTRQDIMSRKYKYAMSWDYMSAEDFTNLENVVNTLSAVTFIYGKWPQCSNGILVIPKLSERTLKSGVGDVFWSSVKLECIEVNSRI